MGRRKIKPVAPHAPVKQLGTEPIAPEGEFVAPSAYYDRLVAKGEAEWVGGKKPAAKKKGASK